ncbi:M48 family metalloprotease [Rhodocyclus tenuis]|uniref:M48 family metalloprotease n=1 Tax=Rhodocyclus tenuis TaxID=1066 RepID=UPI00190311B5|nr:M48 family metalloprotease [Rhodocyclus tenuis]MBK1680086.1 peptidase M48 [Rhodocyclus tenuis]
MNPRPFLRLPALPLPAVPLLLAAFLGMGVLWPAQAADELPDLGESARVDLSPQIERRIGESIMNDIRLYEPTYVDDAEISDYLNRLGGRLVAASANPTGDFLFFAINDSAVNAFAMFGGFIGVNTGTLLTAQTESELAGVLAHEISHVTQSHLARQIAKQKQNSIASMITMAIGILAARSNSQVAGAAIASAQAGSIQAQLAYTRDFEREADRFGYLALEKAGFDVHGMGDFFERLQKAGRVYDSNAPVYLRSHPLTVERISDMQNRAQNAPYRQVVDSLDFSLVRAKLRAQQGTPREAVTDFESQLAEKKYASELAARYGLTRALLRNRDLAGAQREMAQLNALARTQKSASPLLAGLAGEIRSAAGDAPGALVIYRDAQLRFPQARSLLYAYGEALFANQQYDLAMRFLDAQLQLYPSDFKLYQLQAKTWAALGRRLQQHRALAEFYALQGELGQAVEQLQIAQRAGDGDFFELSVVDARLRELRRQQAEEAKRRN